MNNGMILLTAHDLINGDRQADYGTPAENLARVAELWAAYTGHPFTAYDVALMLALLKIAREAHRHKPDNLIDGAAYLGLAADVAGTSGKNETLKEE